MVRKLLTMAVACATALMDAETPDKFVRYVEATGSQAVNVDVIGRYGTKAEIKVEWTATNQLDVAFLDAKGSGDTRVYFCHLIRGQASAGYKTFKYLYNDGTAVWWDLDRIYTVVSEYAVTETNTVYATFSIDGTELWGQTFDSKIDSGKNLYLFANNTGAIENKAKARCYGLKIWQDDANGDRQLVRDFTPCVKDGRAGLYDAVSETIFYSFTGTDLVYDANEDVPDEFIEYVESYGNTYVDTGVIGRSGTRCDADMMWTKLGGDYAFLNARSSSTSNDRIFLIHSNNSRKAMGYGDYIGNYSGGGTYATNTRYSIQSTLRAGQQQLVVNGATAYSGSNANTYDSGVTLYLFANHIGNSIDNRCYARLYSLKIWQDDGNGDEQLVRHFRPCLKKGIACLYDEVSGKLFYPGGAPLGFDNTVDATPDFFVEYIEANGRTSLDTGVRARTGTRAAGEFMWTVLRTRRQEQVSYVEPSSRMERTYLGALGNTISSRFYMLHEYDADLWYAYGDDSGYPAPEGDKIKMAIDRRYPFDISFMSDLQTIDFDGQRVLETNVVTNRDTGCNLYLFACNNNCGLPRYESYARCYGLKLWQDGSLVRDFKPCVKDGKGMLYDMVSRKLFRPVPEIGSAYIGPIVADESEFPTNYVEYVETDCTMYVDTEVPGRSGTTVEFEMQWLSGAAADQSFLGARGTNDASRLFFWHHNSEANALVTYGYYEFRYLAVDSVTPVAYGSAGKRQVVHDSTYHVRASFDVGSQTITANGERYLEHNRSGNLDTGNSLYLFAANIGGVPNYRARARLYWLKIWQDGALVRNFKPVRLTTSGRVALWDKVSKRIFSPRGSNGALKLFSAVGPDGDVIRTRGAIFTIR